MFDRSSSLRLFGQCLFGSLGFCCLPSLVRHPGTEEPAARGFRFRLHEQDGRWRALHQAAIRVKYRKVHAGIRPHVSDNCGKRLLALDMPFRVESHHSADCWLDHVRTLFRWVSALADHGLFGRSDVHAGGFLARLADNQSKNGPRKSARPEA